MLAANRIFVDPEYEQVGERIDRLISEFCPQALTVHLAGNLDIATAVMNFFVKYQDDGSRQAHIQPQVLKQQAQVESVGKADVFVYMVEKPQQVKEVMGAFKFSEEIELVCGWTPAQRNAAEVDRHQKVRRGFLMSDVGFGIVPTFMVLRMRHFYALEVISCHGIEYTIGMHCHEETGGQLKSIFTTAKEKSANYGMKDTGLSYAGTAGLCHEEYCRDGNQESSIWARFTEPVKQKCEEMLESSEKLCASVDKAICEASKYVKNITGGGELTETGYSKLADTLEKAYLAKEDLKAAGERMVDDMREHFHVRNLYFNFPQIALWNDPFWGPDAQEGEEEDGGWGNFQ